MHVCLHAGPNFSYPLYKDCHWAANTFHLSLGAILGAMCEPGQFEASCHAVVLCHRRCHCCCRLVPFVPFARQELLQALALEQERLLRRADEEPEIAGVSAWCQLVPFDAICTFIHSTWGCSMQLRFNVLLGLTDVETRYVGYCQVFRSSVLLTPGAPSMEADAPRKLSLSHTKRTRSRRQVGRSLPREMLDHEYCLRGQWAKWYQMDTNGSKWNKWNTGSTKCRHSVDVSTRLWCQVRLRSLPSCSTCGRATNQSCLRTSILCRFVWTAWTAWTRRNLAPERLLNSFQHLFYSTNILEPRAPVFVGLWAWRILTTSQIKWGRKSQQGVVCHGVSCIGQGSISAIGGRAAKPHERRLQSLVSLHDIPMARLRCRDCCPSESCIDHHSHRAFTNLYKGFAAVSDSP